jgi:hypothetical protein
MDSDRYRCIFRSTIIVFEITGISAPYSFPTISYRFRFREKDVKMKVIWPPIDRFRSFSSLGAGVSCISSMDTESRDSSTGADRVRCWCFSPPTSSRRSYILLSSLTRKTSGGGALWAGDDEDSSVVFRTTSKSIRYFYDGWKHQ